MMMVCSVFSLSVIRSLTATKFHFKYNCWQFTTGFCMWFFFKLFASFDSMSMDSFFRSVSHLFLNYCLLFLQLFSADLYWSTPWQSLNVYTKNVLPSKVYSIVWLQEKWHTHWGEIPNNNENDREKEWETKGNVTVSPRGHSHCEFREREGEKKFGINVHVYKYVIARIHVLSL